MPKWELTADRGLWALSDPRLSKPQPRWGRSAAMVARRTWGQYVAVCSRLQLTSHTQPTSTLSRIKCERYIFIKKCVRSFIEVRILCLIMFLLIFVLRQYNSSYEKGAFWSPSTTVANFYFTFYINMDVFCWLEINESLKLQILKQVCNKIFPAIYLLVSPTLSLSLSVCLGLCLYLCQLVFHTHTHTHTHTLSLSLYIYIYI